MTIAEVLAPFGVAEEEFVESLARELRGAPEVAASRLTGSEAMLLGQRGGIAAPAIDERSVQRTVLGSVSSNLAEQTRESLSVQQAAKLLLVDASRVRHRIRDRALYAFKIGAALRLPTWQFDGHDAIPGLRVVLAALPAELHPLEVGGLMTTPDPDLAVGDEPSSPRDWLVGGGDVDAVVSLARHLDTW